MNKSLFILSVLALVLAVLGSACSNSEDAPVYKVTKSTGLYETLKLDADLLDELPAGTLLKPADNKKDFDCRSLVEAGTTYTLCKVEVINTGQTGWVLQQWTERQ